MVSFNEIYWSYHDGQSRGWRKAVHTNCKPSIRKQLPPEVKAGIHEISQTQSQTQTESYISN